MPSQRKHFRRKNMNLGNFFPEQFKPEHKRVVGLRRNGMLVPTQVLLIEGLNEELLLKRKKIFQKKKEKHELIQKIILDLQKETWNLFCRNGDDFTRDDLNEQERKIYDKVYLFIKNNRVKSVSDLILKDGAKKTLISKNSDKVLKIYTKGVYIVERDAYEKIIANGLHEHFVEHWSFDDDSFTAYAKKLTSSKPLNENAQLLILGVLHAKGLTMTDLKYGDNIGHINGRDVVFDIKSLKKL